MMNKQDTDPQSTSPDDGYGSRNTASAFQHFWSVLGILAAAMAVTNLVSQFFAIGLNGVVADVFENYRAVRDFVLAPLSILANYIGVAIPDMLKDLVALYLIGASGMYYTGASRFADDRRLFHANPGELETTVKSSTEALGKNSDLVWQRVVRGLERPRWFYLVRNPVSALAWPWKLRRNIKQVSQGNKEERQMLWRFVLRLLAVLVVTVAFFLWNYAGSL